MIISLLYVTYIHSCHTSIPQSFRDEHTLRILIKQTVPYAFGFRLGRIYLCNVFWHSAIKRGSYDEIARINVASPRSRDP